MKALKLHYGLSWISCVLCACIIGGELVRVSLEKSNFSLGYVEYIIPLIFVLALAAIYYALFKWNKTVREGASSELFWIVILLGLIMCIVSSMYVIEAWNDIFDKQAPDSYLSNIFRDLLSPESETLRNTEKVLFYLYAAYALIMLIVILLTVSIKSKANKSVLIE